MSLWIQYNTQEDIEPIWVARDLFVKMPPDDLHHEQYEKEWIIQQCTHTIQQYLHRLEFDNEQFQEFVANFPDFDVDYCKQRCKEEISTLLRWNYYVALYFKEKGNWLKDAIGLMLESSKHQKNELFVVFYLVMAFNLNKLYGCKQGNNVKETAIWLVRNMQNNKFIYRCVSIISYLEKSPVVRQEMLDVMMKCAKKADLPGFENYLKSAIEIAADKKPVRNELAKRYENHADEQGEPLLKISYYIKAQEYFQDKEDLRRVASKSRAASKEISFSASAVKQEIQRIEIRGKTNFERLKFLVSSFKSNIPSIEKIRKLAKEIEHSYPLQSMFSRIEIGDDGMSAKPNTSEDEISNDEYKKQFVSHINYVSIVLSLSIRDYENEGKIIVKDYVNYLTSFGLHEKSVLCLIERGIQKHYEEDYISSIHILIPQLENTLRILLEQKGVGVIKTKKSMPMYLTLFHLINNGTEILGNDLAEFLKLKLADPTSDNLRNRVCHSLYEDFSETKGYKPLHDFSHETSLLIILIIMILTDLSTTIAQK